MRHSPTIPYSGLSIILDKPSRHDTKQLISGYAGQFFESCLMPISRYSCEILTAEEYRKGGLREGTKLAFMLGEESLQLVKSNASLNEERGCPFISNDILRLCSYAPQETFDRKNYESPDEPEEDTEHATEKAHQQTKRRNFRFWLYNDIKKAVRLVRSGKIQHPNFSYRIYPSAEEVIKILQSTTGLFLYLDIETDKALNLTCFGFSFLSSPGEAIPEDHPIYVVPFKRCYNALAYEASFIYRIIQALCVAMHRNTCVLHNASFDLFVLCYKYRIPFPKQVFDSMLAWHRCYPEVEKSLGHVISYFTDLPYHKNDGVFDPKNTQQEDQLWRYNGKDISSLMLVHQGLLKEIVKQRAEGSVIQAMASIRPYLTMMFNGLRIDIPRFLKRFEELDFERKQLGRCLEVIVGKKLNPRSPQQVAKYLYEEIGLPLPDKELTKEETLLKLLIKNPIPSLKVILAYRGKGKAASSLKFRLWNRGNKEYTRATCVYGIAGTDTFRLSSKTLLKFGPKSGFGTNLQNWNKKQRDLVIADEGKVLAQTDQSGAEALIVAYLCRNGKFRSLFLNGIKPHTYLAIRLFKEFWADLLGLPDIEEYIETAIPYLNKLKYWKDLNALIKSEEHHEKYYVGKKTCHSANYDIKAPTFQKSILKDTEGKTVLSLEQCKFFLSAYRDLFPEIPEWHINTQEELKNGRVLCNLFGYPRRFLEPMGDSLWKQAYAFRPQSTVGSITNIAITELQQKIEIDADGMRSDYQFDLLQNGHDSILWQCVRGKEIECAKIVKHHLERELEWRGEKFKMGSETAIGENWAPFSEKNPGGLKEIKF